MQEQQVMRTHKLEVIAREKICATGVQKIEYFSPEAVAAKTSCGKLIIKGSNLYVESLNAETGDLLIRGRVNEIIYTENDDEKNWLKRLFK